MIVTLIADEEEILCIEAEEDELGPRYDDSLADLDYDSQVVRSGIDRESDSFPERKSYYHRVIDRLEDANYVFIFGPGLARKELRAEILKMDDRTVKIAGTQPADEMTPEDIAVKVRRYFVTA